MAHPLTSDEDSESFNQPTSTLLTSDEDSESFNQPISTPSRKRNRNYSENLWPKRMKKDHSNILVAHVEGKYETLESVIVEEKRYFYFQHLNCKYELTLSHNTFEIETSTFTMKLPYEPTEDDARFDKAKFLYQQVMSFPHITDVNNHQIHCRTYRPARVAELESDGEDIHDPEVFPEFDDVQLPIVTLFFRQFFSAHEAALKIGLFNAVGKEFLDSAWEYMDLCQSSLANSSKFKYLHNTSKGESQPGAMFVKWSFPPRDLRSGIDNRIIQTNERYADQVVYDKVNIINVNVSEVKENAESAIEAQNNEQMLGLWKGSQQVMLGLEVQWQ